MKQGPVDIEYLVDNIYTNFTTTLDRSFLTSIETYDLKTRKFVDLLELLKKDLRLQVKINITPRQLITFLNDEIDRHPDSDIVLELLQKFIIEKMYNIEDNDDGTLYDYTIMKNAIISITEKLPPNYIAEIIELMQRKGFEKT